MSTRLGLYDLERPLGRGGMGEVWAAVHRPSGQPVALKVVHEAITNQAPLRDEVEAAASLNHRGIVQVFDLGVAPHDVGPARRGQPYLVMERVDGGTLHDRLGQLTWPETRRLLDELLAALAFSHARGIIHRDVKPANVLLTSDGAVRLADFGLAFALGAGGAHTSGGTPRYMAPEQRRSWRDHGPWTDLHAVGWVATAMVRGRPDLDVPAVIPLPTWFDAWVDRLVDPDPATRFRRAADARHALFDLEAPITVLPSLAVTPPPPEPVALAGPTLMSLDDDTPSSRHTLLPLDDGPAPALPTLVLPEDEEASATTGHVSASLPERPLPRSVSRLATHARPPLPERWQRDDAREPPPPMVGVGLGLVGLRVQPLVDREHEREQLWRALHRASTRPTLRVLSGPSGAGKSRLAAWLGARAHELGAATVLSAEHGPDAGRGHGLGAMLSRHLRVEGLVQDRRLLRIRQTLMALGDDHADAAEALDAMVGLAEGLGEGPRYHFGNDGERWHLILRLILRHAARRPVVLWLDDVQWGLDALGLAQHLLRNAPADCPLLVVCTVRDEALFDQPEAEEQLIRLIEAAGDPEVRIPVGPLPAADHRALLSGLLGLDDALFGEVEERTGGNPLFAVELVSRWAQSGALVPAPGGFRLDRRKAGSLPESLRTVWSERVDRALEGQPAEAARSAELLAVLGPIVDPRAWDRACAAAGLRPDRAVVDALRAQRLIKAERDGWHLAHGMLRETLEARADAAGHLPELHRAAARALDGAAQPGRQGLHLLRAGDPLQALPLLLEGARDAIDVGDAIRAARLLEAARSAFRDSDLSDNALERAILPVLEARNAQRRGKYVDTVRAATQAYEQALQHDQFELALAGACLASRAVRLIGNLAESRTWIDRAMALRPLIDNPWVRLNVDLAAGTQHVRAGELDKAERALQQGRAEAARGRAEGWPRPAWYHQYPAAIDENLAAVARQRGDVDAMDRHLHASIRQHHEDHYALGEVSSMVTMGEALRARNQLDAAMEMFDECRRRLDALGSPFEMVPRLNQALIRILRGQDEAAMADVAELLPRFAAMRRRNLEGLCLLIRCAAHAGAASWDALDLDADQAIERIDNSGFVDIDVVRVANLAAQRAEDARQRLRAAPLRDLARRQIDALGMAT